MLYTADAFPGRIYKLTLDGKVLGMLGKAGKELKAFGWIHAMACPDEKRYRRRDHQLARPEAAAAPAKDGEQVGSVSLFRRARG